MCSLNTPLPDPTRPNLRIAAPKRWGIAFAWALAMLIGFIWGFQSHKHHVFPYFFVRAMVTAAHGTSAPHSSLVTVAPVPPRAPLTALPYVSDTYDPDHQESGTLVYDRDRAYHGVTLYGPRREPLAQLIGMNGSVLHEWRGTAEAGWQHVDLLPDGGLLVLVKDQELFRIDASSRRLWTYRARVHHDLDVEAGRIWVLERLERQIPSLHPTNPIISDRISVLDLDTGERLQQLDVLDSILGSRFRFLIPDAYRMSFSSRDALDLLHANHVEIIQPGHEATNPLFAAGNLLISMRNLNAIAILDRGGRVLWLWGPNNVQLQHHPTLLDNGHILLFDNGTERSSVKELDVGKGRVVWEYSSPDFFSQIQGSVQRLPNGNTLITESTSGYLFEVDQEGRTVWEFANPFVSKDGKRSAIWRATRFDESVLREFPKR